MQWWLAYLAIGIAVGFFAGLLGIGGGAVMVPMLVLVFTAQGLPSEHVMHIALGTAMAAMFSALLTLGEPERAKEWVRRAVLLDPDNLGMRYNLACDLIVNLRDYDGALELLGSVFRNGGAEQLAWLKSDPDIDAIRDDPRFMALVEETEARLGTAPA